jgi:hypothetical protein
MVTIGSSNLDIKKSVRRGNYVMIFTVGSTVVELKRSIFLHHCCAEITLGTIRLNGGDIAPNPGGRLSGSPNICARRNSYQHTDIYFLRFIPLNACQTCPVK